MLCLVGGVAVSRGAAAAPVPAMGQPCRWLASSLSPRPPNTPQHVQVRSDNRDDATWEPNTVLSFCCDCLSAAPSPASQPQCVQVRSDNQDDAKWEKGDNRTLTVPSEGATSISVLIDWSGDAEVEVTPAGAQPAPMAAAVAGAVEGTGSLASAGSGSDSEGGYASSGAVSGSMTSSFDDSMALLPQWQGKELRFMQSNEHTRWVAWLGREWTRGQARVLACVGKQCAGIGCRAQCSAQPTWPGLRANGLAALCDTTGSGRVHAVPTAACRVLAKPHSFRTSCCPHPPLVRRERQGVWNTDGLQGAALHLVAGDRDAPNWLSKLEVLKKLLVDKCELLLLLLFVGTCKLAGAGV